MAHESNSPDPFDKLERDGKRMLDGFERAAIHRLNAQGNTSIVPVATRMLRVIKRLLSKVLKALKRLLGESGLVDLAGTIFEGVSDILQDIMDGALQAIEELLEALDTITDAALGAVLGLIEAFKKVIHLVLDKLPKNPLSDVVELNLDILDNILGNLAEVVSTGTGKLAATFRTNMYDQLYMIRRARGAQGAVEPREPPGALGNAPAGG